MHLMLAGCPLSHKILLRIVLILPRYLSHSSMRSRLTDKGQWIYKILGKLQVEEEMRLHVKMVSGFSDDVVDGQHGHDMIPCYLDLTDMVAPLDLTDMVPPYFPI